MSWVMKILRRLFYVLGLCVLSSSVLVAAPERYKIDTTHSSVSFKIRHLGVSWVQGMFKDYEGEVLFDPEKPEASSVTVTVKAASVDTGNEKRDNHLRNADYFHVEKFPTLSFKSTKVEKTGENRYKVTGDFTLLGVTKPLVVDFIATDEIEGMRGEKRRGGETSFTIKRSDFGMKQSIGPIGDEVHVSLSFAGVKE
jgi:polyisoprenoid-binding protein YceI